MATFLFAWNPKKWEWNEDDFTQQILKVAATGSAKDSGAAETAKTFQ